MSTLEQRLWLFTSTKMPCVKVPGSPVSWIASIIKLVTITMVVSMMELVMTLRAVEKARVVVDAGPQVLVEQEPLAFFINRSPEPCCD